MFELLVVSSRPAELPLSADSSVPAHSNQARLGRVSLCAVTVPDLANKPVVCNQPWALRVHVLCPAGLK